MTIKEIAKVANVDEVTIRRWAKKASDKMPSVSGKMTGALMTKVAANFTLPETIAIVRAGDNDTLANLLEQNASETATAKAPRAASHRLPNGAQMLSLAKIYGSQEAAKRMDFLIGYSPVPPALAKAILPAPAEPEATTEQMNALLDEVRAMYGPDAKQAKSLGDYVERRELERKQAKIVQDALNFQLFPRRRESKGGVE